MNFRSTASAETLRQRAELLRRTRAFFDARQFIEVQTPILSADTVVDRHLDPVPVLLPHDAFDLTSGRPMYLQTSPEFLMKRLMLTGLPAIYQITPALRIGESGEMHNPEFTMLEWYRCGDDMDAGIRLLSEYASEILERPTARIQSVSDAFESLAGFDPFSETDAQLRQRCIDASLSYPESLAPNDWDSWFEILFGDLVQPKLGVEQPDIIYGYPASQAALAKVQKDAVPIAERFELFVDGIELANGYHELQDADELTRRNQTVNQQRARDGKTSLPGDSRLIAAMRAGFPACSGVAVGFDRLVMVATGANTIRDALSFPIDRA